MKTKLKHPTGGRQLTAAEKRSSDRYAILQLISAIMHFTRGHGAVASIAQTVSTLSKNHLVEVHTSGLRRLIQEDLEPRCRVDSELRCSNRVRLEMSGASLVYVALDGVCSLQFVEACALSWCSNDIRTACKDQ